MATIIVDSLEIDKAYNEIKKYRDAFQTDFDSIYTKYIALSTDQYWTGSGRFYYDNIIESINKIAENLILDLDVLNNILQQSKISFENKDKKIADLL